MVNFDNISCRILIPFLKFYKIVSNSIELLTHNRKFSVDFSKIISLIDWTQNGEINYQNCLRKNGLRD